MRDRSMYIVNLGQKFRQVASEYSDLIAVRTDCGHLTYSELNSKSDEIAHYFIGLGLNVGDVVSVVGEKSLSTIVFIIGAIKAGVTYSVFDPDTPVTRLEKIFEKCKPKLVICNASQVLSLGHLEIRSITSDDLSTNSQNATSDVLSLRIDSLTGVSPAYIMFTSGSTGFPKGAIMSHQNVLNLIAWSCETYSFGPGEILTSVNPLFFDNSVFDIFSSLFSGATLVLFDAQTVRNPAKLLQLIDQYECTSWFSVPSMLIYLQNVRALQRTSFKHLRRIIFGGEGYPKAKLKQLFDLFASRIEFYNVYGPTECTCICSSYKVEIDDFEDLNGFLPLGKMSKNFEPIVVDSELQVVHSDQLGELLLRGPNVGLGYVNDPERTQGGFIQNPIHNAYRDIVYRTGDLVCYDSTMQKFLIAGRSDNQIKHMGYRIELEEIENALSCIQNVAQCAVVHCESRGLSQLVAFIKPTNGVVEETFLREQLSLVIPAYMIPTKFQLLNELPKNANGKLDRNHMKRLFLEQAQHV